MSTLGFLMKIKNFQEVFSTRTWSRHFLLAAISKNQAASSSTNFSSRQITDCLPVVEFTFQLIVVSQRPHSCMFRFPQLQRHQLIGGRSANQFDSNILVVSFPEGRPQESRLIPPQSRGVHCNCTVVYIESNWSSLWSGHRQQVVIFYPPGSVSLE